MLLSALGIPDDVILRKQDEYYKLLARSLEDEDCALKMLLTHDEVRTSSASLGKQSWNRQSLFEWRQRTRREIGSLYQS